MQNSVEEIAKNSKSWKKMYGKYIRLIQDAEGSIIARDAAIREYAEKINNIPNEEGFFNRSITMVFIFSFPLQCGRFLARPHRMMPQKNSMINVVH